MLQNNEHDDSEASAAAHPLYYDHSRGESFIHNFRRSALPVCSAFLLAGRRFGCRCGDVNMNDNTSDYGKWRRLPYEKLDREKQTANDDSHLLLLTNRPRPGSSHVLSLGPPDCPIPFEHFFLALQT